MPPASNFSILAHTYNPIEAVISKKYRYFQLKVNMKTGEVIGVEAMIRWQHPQRGLLPPAAFLSIIEDHPISVALVEWVIATALSQMSQCIAPGLTFGSA